MVFSITCDGRWHLKIVAAECHQDGLLLKSKMTSVSRQNWCILGISDKISRLHALLTNVYSSNTEWDILIDIKLAYCQMMQKNVDNQRILTDASIYWFGEVITSPFSAFIFYFMSNARNKSSAMLPSVSFLDVGFWEEKSDTKLISIHPLFLHWKLKIFA